VKGPLTPEQQLQVMGKIWGNDRDGYVFLPHIDGSARTTEKRRRSYHEGRAYEWPKDKPAILAHLQGHTTDDVYFTPGLFNAKRRTEQNVDAERTLWADLDPVDPHTLGDLRPTIAWESSPGRYQAVWLLDRPRVGASWPSKENHRLSLHLGADPSGWDSTQLLRVPGRNNHKPAYGKEPVPGVLLWDNGPRYLWEDFDDLPEVGLVGDADDVELLDEELLAGIDRHTLWSTVRLKVSKRVREYMSSRSATGDRSEVLWEIERELADAGCSVVEIVALVRPTPWNKYAGRNDELRRLKTEAAKAISLRQESTLEHDAADEPAKPGINWLSQLVQIPIGRPRWLIEGIWTRGGCGFIAGQPKSYKSWLGLDMAVSLATGTPFLGLPEHGVRIARPVLLIQEEDDLRLVMSRLSSVLEAKAPRMHWQGLLELSEPPGAGPGGDLGVTKGQGQLRSVAPVWRPPTGDVPLAVHVQGGFIASDPGWQSWLSETVAEGKFGLVVIDTLGTTAGEVDTDRAGELMTRILRPLKTVAQELGTGVCLIHHNRKGQAGEKNGGSRAGQDMLGSVALHAWVDCAIYARTREAGELQLEREAKLAPEVTLRVRVPTMGENVRTGARVLWSPERVQGPVEAGAEQPPGAAGDTPPASRTERPTGSNGAAMRVKLKGIGLDRGPVSADRVEQALGEALVRRLVRDGVLIHDEAPDQYRWPGARSSS
jgi:hypothetical protein